MPAAVAATPRAAPGARSDHGTFSWPGAAAAHLHGAGTIVASSVNASPSRAQAAELYAFAAKALDVPGERLRLVCRGKAIDRAAGSLALDPSGRRLAAAGWPAAAAGRRLLWRVRAGCPLPLSGVQLGLIRGCAFSSRPSPSARCAAIILAVPLPKGPDEAIRRAAAADKGLDDDEGEDAFTLPEGAQHPAPSSCTGARRPASPAEPPPGQPPAWLPACAPRHGRGRCCRRAPACSTTVPVGPSSPRPAADARGPCRCR